MVTHYPLCLESGKQEKIWRRLRDAHCLRDLPRSTASALAARPSARELFPPCRCIAAVPGRLCRQRHATGRWSYNEYTFADGQMHGRRRVWSPEKSAFVDGDEFSLPFALE